MQQLSSFINNNYDSPNIKDIKKVLRKREIEEIDKKLSSRNLIKANTINENDLQIFDRKRVFFSNVSTL